MAFLNHVEQIQTGITRRVRKVLMRRAIKMQDSATFIDEDKGGIKMLQKHFLIQVRKFKRRLLVDPGLHACGHSDACREIPDRYRSRGLSAINLKVSGNRLKQLF